MIRPRLVIPIHWGTLFPFGLRRLRPPVSDGAAAREFARQVGRLAPDVEVRVLDPAPRPRWRENEQRRLDRPGGLGRAPRHSALTSDRLVLLGSRRRAARNRRAELRRSPDDHRPGRGAQRGVVAALDPAASPAHRPHFRARLAGPETRRSSRSRSSSSTARAPDFLGAILVAFHALGRPDAARPRAQHRRRRETAVSFADERGRSATPTAPTYPA